MNRDRQTVKEQLAAHYALSRQLDEDYEKVYTDMVVYIRTSPLTEAEAEEIINDILVMMLEGQARGASVTAVFGEDYQGFCDAMIASMGRGSLGHWLKVQMNLLFPSLNATLFFSWLINMDTKSITDIEGLTTVNLSAAFLLMMAFMWLGVFVIFTWINKSVYSKSLKQLPSWKSAALGGLLFTVVVFCAALAAKAAEGYVLMRFHVGWLIGLMIIIWAAGRVMGGITARAQERG